MVFAQGGLDLRHSFCRCRSLIRIDSSFCFLLNRGGLFCKDTLMLFTSLVPSSDDVSDSVINGVNVSFWLIKEAGLADWTLQDRCPENSLQSSLKMTRLYFRGSTWVTQMFLAVCYRAGCTASKWVCQCLPLQPYSVVSPVWCSA